MNREKRWDEKPQQPEAAEITQYLRSAGLKQNEVLEVLRGNNRRIAAAALREQLRKSPKAK